MNLSQEQLIQIFEKVGKDQIPGVGNDRDITERAQGPFVEISEQDLRSVIPELPDPKKNMHAYHEKVSDVFGGWASTGGMLRSLGGSPVNYRIELDLNRLNQALK
jgi:hypothetical protein